MCTDTIHDLVADGLITLYLEAHASEYIASLGNACNYEESPYMTLHKSQKQQKSRQRKQQAQRVTNYNEIKEEEEEGNGHMETDGAVDVKMFEKAHAFKVNNFMGLPWCDFCGNFMWGLMAQGI